VVSSSPERSAAGRLLGTGGEDVDAWTLLRAFHQMTVRMHSSSDITQTLQLIAHGVTEFACFRVAALNLAIPDVGFEVVAVVGPPDARKALLGLRGTGEQWGRLLAQAQRWGSLCWIDHRSSAWDETLSSWTPEPEQVGSNDGGDDAWHPDDLLFAPLIGPDGEMLGMLSVDLPVGGLKPVAAQLEVLELFADSAALAIHHSRLVDTIRAQHQRSQYLASHDPLTGLTNRHGLEASIINLLDRAPEQLAVLVIDLDRFKHVNDTFGHHAGDEVLVAVARRMERCLRQTDILGRTGGDEFVVVIGGPDAGDRIGGVKQRLHDVVSQPIKGAAGMYEVGASIGMAVSEPPHDLVNLFHAADADMYRTKRERRSLTYTMLDRQTG
jgi:diguanylate cyclase (GGDEF)-like protein